MIEADFLCPIDRQRSVNLPSDIKLRAAGAMPTTIVEVSLRMIVRPMSPRSAPKRRFHRPFPSMDTGAALGCSSSSVNARPAIGGIPSTRVSAGLIRLPESCSGSPVPVIVQLLKPTAASSLKLLDCSR